LEVLKEKIIIIGAGPIGLMCGIYAHWLGLEPTIITLANANQKTAGFAAGGMLAPAYEAFDSENFDLIEFLLDARNEWEESAAKLGIKIDSVALALGRDESDLARLEKMQQTSVKYALDFAFCAVPEFLNAKYALNLKSDALISPPLAMVKMRNAFLALGGKIIEDEIIGIETSQAIGKSKKYEASAIIIANGYFAKDFSNCIGAVSRLRAVRGQTMAIDKKPNFIGSMRYKTTYLMARGENIVIGATSQFDDDIIELRQSDSLELYNNAVDLYPQISGAKILDNYVGIRPLIDGELPIIGPSEIEGVFLAIGAYRNGWAMAPLIAKTIISHLKNGAQISSKLLPNAKA
jgi:glycine oxidase